MPPCATDRTFCSATLLTLIVGAILGCDGAPEGSIVSDPSDCSSHTRPCQTSFTDTPKYKCISPSVSCETSFDPPEFPTDLAISMSGPDSPPRIDDRIAVEILVENLGPSFALGVFVIVQVPPGAQFAATSINCQAYQQTVQCLLGSLDISALASW